MSISETSHGSIDLDEAARQLQQAAHDAQVAYDCISLGDLDWAHTNSVTARAEADAAEHVLRAVLAGVDGHRRRPVTAPGLGAHRPSPGCQWTARIRAAPPALADGNRVRSPGPFSMLGSAFLAAGAPALLSMSCRPKAAQSAPEAAAASVSSDAE